MSKIELKGISKRYGNVEAVADLSLVIEQGKFVTFLGPSGSGKTTTMRMIAGLERPDTGTIRIGDNAVSDDRTFVPTYRRQLGMVFQSYAVWPHKTVEQNVLFPLQQRGFARAEHKQRVRNILERVGLGGHAQRYPSQLSGGQQQRVSLARALVAEPSVVLFDEPLSNLDAKLRDSMRDLLAEMHLQFGTTSVYVTHDQEEAMMLSDTVHIMNQGRLIQSGRPEDLYERPASRFVADFIGSANTLEIAGLENVDTGSVRVTLRNGLRLDVAPGAERQAHAKQRENVLIIRPQQISVVGEDVSDNVVAGSVRTSNYLGDRCRYLVDVGAGISLTVETGEQRQRLLAGAPIRLHLPRSACVVI